MEISEQAENMPAENLPVEMEKVNDDLEVVSAPPTKKARKNAKPNPPKVADNKRNWLDSEVEALIALKGEMQPEFAKKQGVDMWVKLHSRLLCLHPNFRKTPKACKSKFSDVFKAYKEDKQANIISGAARHTCKFYNSMDRWYPQNGLVIKHVHASSSDMGSAEGATTEVVEDSELTTPSTLKQRKVNEKLKYQEQMLNLMARLVDNHKDMADSMKVVNGFLSNLDKHMEKLIEKL